MTKKTAGRQIDKALNSGVFFAACLAVGVLGIAVQCWVSFSRDIWVDEAFSLKMIQHGYAEMIRLTAMDVHPPLYYLILKFFTDLFPETVPAVYAAKLVSVIPFVLTLCAICGTVRRNWGTYTAGILTVCLVAMPNVGSYGVEVRMYSWAMYFVFVAFLETCAILKEAKTKNWVCLVLFSLGAAYTHYFASVAVALFYLVLCIWAVFRARQCLRAWICAAVCTAAGYFPWLLVLLRQLRAVKESYWIGAIDSAALRSYVRFAFDGWLLTALAVLGIAVFVYGAVKRAISVQDGIAAVTAAAVPLWTVLVGVAASLLIRPVFVARYMMPGLICMWLGLTLMYAPNRNGVLKLLYTAVIFTVGAVQMLSFIMDERYYCTESEKTAAFFEMNKGAVYISDSKSVQRTAATMSGDMAYVIGEEGQTTPLSYAVYGEELLGDLSDPAQLTDLMQQEADIYLLDSSGEALQKLTEDADVRGVSMGVFRVESAVEVYKLEPVK